MIHLLQDVLRRIVPSLEEEQHLQKSISNLIHALSKLKPFDAVITLVGSVAKDTHIKNDLDVDLFIMFPESYTKKEMADITLDIGKKTLTDWHIQYAEHPYIKGIYEGYKIDIVPCYHITDSSQKISAVDRTPFHTTFIQENLTDKMKNEVRLLKQFLKGISCYGAESKIEGFSGYLTELLILKYNSFMNTLKASQLWKPHITLSLNNEKHTTEDSHFVFIDPVDDKRNVAAALSKDKYKLFTYAAKEFIKNPKITFFFPKRPKPIPKKILTDHLQNFIAISLKTPNISEDILFPQLKKAAANLVTKFKSYDFTVLGCTWQATGEAFIAIQLKNFDLDETKTHRGPFISDSENAAAFTKKWLHSIETIEGPYKKNKRLWVTIKRKYTNAFTLLEHEVKNVNFGKNLNKYKDTVRICKGIDLLPYTDFWYEFFSENYSWEW